MYLTHVQHEQNKNGGFMTAIATIYAQILHENLKMVFATWPLGAPVQLGDYGKMQHGYLFSRLGNIGSDYGIKVTEKSGVETSWKYKSSKTDEVNIKAGSNVNPNVPGGPPIAVKANLTISFKRENAVYFNAAKCTYYGIDNQIAVNKRVLELFGQEQWDGDYVVVTSLFKAGATTAIISSSNNSAVTIEASGDVPNIDLADASAGLFASSEKNVSLTVVAESGFVPLLGLAKVVPKDWLNAIFGGERILESMGVAKTLSSVELTTQELSGMVETKTPKLAKDTGKSVEDVYEVRPLQYL